MLFTSGYVLCVAETHPCYFAVECCWPVIFLKVGLHSRYALIIKNMNKIYSYFILFNDVFVSTFIQQEQLEIKEARTFCRNWIHFITYNWTMHVRVLLLLLQRKINVFKGIIYCLSGKKKERAIFLDLHAYYFMI